MKMPQVPAVLKSQRLLPLLEELEDQVLQAAQAGTPIHELEQSVWQQVLRIGRQAMGQFLALLGTGDLGESVELPDGRCCHRLEERHSRRYVSIFGPFEIERTVYGSREGQKIDFVPLDNRLQLPAAPFSYLLQDWDQSFCVEQAFGPSAQVIRRILGLQQSVDSLEHMNVDMASSVVDFREAQPRPQPKEEGALLVLSADGKGIVMRREHQAARPAAHRRKGDKANQKRMAMVGAVYTVDPYPRTPEEVVAALFRDGPPPTTGERPQPCHKRVWASLAVDEGSESISGQEVIYTWLRDAVEQRNPRGSKPMVHISDGQESLWKARDEYLPQEHCTDVLDLLHVASRVWQAAHVFHREGSAHAERFARERLLRILQGHSQRVVRGLREMASKRGLGGAKKKALERVCAYFVHNRDRMRYDVYLARGYPIASGIIEGACRHLVKDRMERAGMHWTPRGAQAMLDVRSIYVNGEWEPFQAFRIQQETRRLYPFKQLVEGPHYHLAC